jgi:hypothetical protein
VSAQIVEFLKRVRLCGPDEAPRAEPLSGGVSSDIWRVDLARGPVCVKRALPRLRVAQLWEAPIERNRFEYEWLQVAGAAAPTAVPRVLAQEGGAFVMEYLDPARYPVWKSLLLQGLADAQFGAKVGGALREGHATRTGAARRMPRVGDLDEQRARELGRRLAPRSSDSSGAARGDS